MRIQINLSDDMVKRVDAIASNYGVPRSTLLALWIGQTVTGVEEVTKQAAEQVKAAIN